MYLFLSRRYNDIDHIVPIIYRMAKDGINKIVLLCLTPTLDIKNDFRIRFLKKEFHLQIQHAYEAHTPTFFHRIMAWLICRPYAGDQNLLLHSFLERLWLKIKNFFAKNVSRRLANLGQRFFFTQTWADDLVEKLNPSVLVMDWQEPSKGTYLVESCKKKDIPIIAVPHGVNLMVNEDFILDKKTGLPRPPSDFGKKWKDFDYSIVNSQLYRDMVVRNGAPSDRVIIIGATRYCSEWKNIYNKILPAQNEQWQKNITHSDNRRRVNIVFMDHSSAYRLHGDTVLKTIRRILDRGDVNLIIKPSPGSLGFAGHRADQKVSSPELLRIARIGNDIHSLSLIQWADAVISVTSSICIEVLLHNKIFLYPKYFHENTMAFEEFGSCWLLNDEEQFFHAIDKIIENRGYRPYTEENVRCFLEKHVYGGVPDRDVLGEYAIFLQKVSANDRLSTQLTRMSA